MVSSSWPRWCPYSQPSLLIRAQRSRVRQSMRCGSQSQSCCSCAVLPPAHSGLSLLRKAHRARIECRTLSSAGQAANSPSKRRSERLRDDCGTSCLSHEEFSKIVPPSARAPHRPSRHTHIHPRRASGLRAAMPPTARVLAARVSHVDHDRCGILMSRALQSCRPRDASGEDDHDAACDGKSTRMDLDSWFVFFHPKKKNR